jgi:uncharacterized membrane protein HdeD (DUF308 family)
MFDRNLGEIKVLIQKSEMMKIIKLVIGGIVIVFSGYRFFNMTNPSPFFITYPGIAVLVIGIVDILKGILNKKESKTAKSIEIGIGIIAIVVGLFVVVYLTDVSSRSTWLIFLFIIIQGIGFVGTGITQKSKSKAIRISKIMIGIIFVTFTGLLLKYPDLSLIMISGLLSFNLLLIGIEVVVGAINHKKVDNSTNPNYDKSNK